MPKALINGVNIYYESHGSGFPLVLSYGLGGNTSKWAGQVAAFSQRYQFITWDPRGHGQSDAPTERDKYGLQISAEDMRSLLDHLGIDRAYVGGLSMGGGTAARLTIAHPERVAALLIIDSFSASGLPFTPATRAFREKTIEIAETQGMEALADYSIQANENLRTLVESGPEGRAAVRQTFLELDPIGYTNTIRAILEPDFSTEQLTAIKAPTLVLVGGEDPALEAARLTETKIAGSEMVIIPGAGHLSNLDKPDEFNSHILKFLQKVEAGVSA